MIPLQTIKDYLGITVDTHNGPLTASRDRIWDAVSRELDWYFGPPRPIIEIRDGNGRGFIGLRQPPVLSEPLVVATRTGVGSTDWYILADNEYEVSGRLLYHVNVWPPGRRNISITYHEGFEAIPGDIQQLILEAMQAEVVVGDVGSIEGAVKSESLGDYSYTLADSVVAAGSGFLAAPSWSKVRNNWKRARI